MLGYDLIPYNKIRYDTIQNGTINCVRGMAQLIVYNFTVEITNKAGADRDRDRVEMSG